MASYVERVLDYFERLT